MIMAPCDFEVSPDTYNRLFGQNFRCGGDGSGREKVSFNQLDKTRRKVRKWMAENTQFFSL